MISGDSTTMTTNIYIWVHHREGLIEEVTFGLAAEAGRIISARGEQGTITAIAVGNDFVDSLHHLGMYGVNRVVQFKGKGADRYQGECYAGALYEFIQPEIPFAFLMAHTAETADLGPRLAALKDTGVITRAIDLKIGGQDEMVAMRLIANGHLSEEVCFECQPPYLVTLLPAVLNTPEPEGESQAVIVEIELAKQTSQSPRTEIVEIIEGAPEDLDITEADIVVAAGRGAGKDEYFEVIHDLAGEIGGSVACTRPVVDWQTLPYERQIGQTGKTVTAQLIINCGISGANEYTAGMQKSRNVVAINTDPRARIFQFADLGVVGDVHQVLPLLIKRLKEKKGSDTKT
jgi:electron transfer flavoprotein alpha subunit